MTWTFEEDYTLIGDQIRVMIGDTDTNDQLVSDEAIAFFYAQAGSDLVGGALKAARAAAAKLAKEFDRDLDGLKTSRSQRHKAMLDTIAQLEAEQAQGNYTFTAPSASNAVADVANYPTEFEHSDIAAPDWSG